MNFGLKNKVALVTGASKNIGRAISFALAKEGARVILVSHSEENMRDTLREIPGGAGKHLGITLDLQLEGSHLLLRKSLSGSFLHPEIIVHNLGGSLGVTNAFAPVSDWARVWHFNLGIAHELNRLFIPKMISRKWGRVLHLSTLSTYTFNGYASYVSAKCALDGYIKTMSREVSRHNVLINALAPGVIDLKGRYFSRLGKENPVSLEQYFDNHLPMRRLGTLDEIAAVAIFLCSDQASLVTGSIVRADGGGC